MSIHVVLVGPDRGLGSAFETRSARVERIDGVGSDDALRAAGIEDADLLVLTDVREATAVPVALERNPALRVVVFTPETLPEFVRAQVDIAISPDVLGAADIADELAGTG